MKELLTTIDGVKAYDCDALWVIREVVRYGEPEKIKLLDNVFDLYKDKGYFFFWFKENALKFMDSFKKNKAMLEFQNPIPVIVENDKEGYALYVRDGHTWENDIWCIVHCESGIVRHYRSDQIRLHHNATFDINKSKNNQQ